MNILHVTPAYYPATYWGGPTFSLYGLCNALIQIHDVKLKVLATNTAGPDLSQQIHIPSVPVRYDAGYDVYFANRIIGADIAPEMLPYLWRLVQWADIVHLTAVYSFPTFPTLAICRYWNKPVVWSPRGSLQRWEYSKKRNLKSIWEKMCVCLSDKKMLYLHTTSEEERAASSWRIPGIVTTVIPNGVDIPSEYKRYQASRERLRIIYIGRLHPIKGIENLLQSLALTKTNVQLDIYGTGDDTYVQQLKSTASHANTDLPVIFHGQIEGKEKTEAFINADICVVPSYSENFGMVVVEALSYGVPVISSKGTPWAGLVEHDCGMWVDNTPESLAAAIDSLANMDLASMGQRGRAWMQSDFSWEAIAQTMYDYYNSILSGNREYNV